MGKYSAEIGNFTIAPDIIVQELGLITACVYGRIWRYEQMSSEVCKAAIKTLANDLGVSYNTVLTYIGKLIKAGYIKDLTPSLKNRPHIYKTTGRLRIEINISSTPQNFESEDSGMQNLESTPQLLESTPQNLDSHSSKFGDESDSLRDKLTRQVNRQDFPVSSFSPQESAKLKQDFNMLDEIRQLERVYTMATGHQTWVDVIMMIRYGDDGKENENETKTLETPENNTPESHRN